MKHWRGIAGHQSGLDGMAGRVDKIHMDSHGTFFWGGEAEWLSDSSHIIWVALHVSTSGHSVPFIQTTFCTHIFRVGVGHHQCKIARAPKLGGQSMEKRYNCQHV